MDGLGVLAGIAIVGLVIHILGPYNASRRWSQQTAMGIMFVLCAAGCWGLLRGTRGDMNAPIPDGSAPVRALGWLRRFAGIAIGCWGAWLFVLGIRSWGQSADGFDRALNLMFVAGGPLWLIIGMALALRRGRDGA